jgi:multidrug efflux pump subunit AcrB
MPKIDVDLPQMNTTGGTFTTSPTKTSSIINNVSKWVPLICAGAAVGVSVIALKEIKNVRKELVNMKKEQIISKTTGVPETLTRKIEELDEQLKKITEYLKTKSEQDVSTFELCTFQKTKDKFCQQI